MKKTLITAGALAATMAGATASANALTIDAAKAVYNDAGGLPVVNVAYNRGEVRRMLRRQGYRDIQIVRSGWKVYKVNACRRDRRFRLKIKRRDGYIKSRARIGRCDARFDPVPRPRPGRFGLSLPEIRSQLRDRGFRRIRFTDRRLPVYQASACKRGKRFNLRMNRFGEIRRRTRQGWCDGGYGLGPMPRPALSMREIRFKLRDRGFRRIRFTDRSLPVYQANACKRGKSFHLWLNRRGNVRYSKRTGWCGFRGVGLQDPYNRPGVYLNF